MSFYSTPVKQLTALQLDELVTTRAQENLQLEFKREQADRDEHLKKVSSFANTMGGRIVYGIEQDQESRALRLSGIDRNDQFEAQLTSWCAHYLQDPLIPEVSPAISLAGTSKVVYVVDVSESELAPHFIGGRKGCYIRTNEGSRRFEPKLADQGELRALLNRREEARARGAALRIRSESRAEKRLEMLKAVHRASVPWVPIIFRAALRYPLRPLGEPSSLGEVVRGCSFDFDASRFPHEHAGVYSHADSLIYSQPRHALLSLLEVTSYGSVTYTDFLQAEGTHSHTDFPGAQAMTFATVVAGRALGAAHLGAKIAARFLEALGARGGLVLSVVLRDLKKTGFVSGHRKWPAGLPFLDEAIEVSRETTCDRYFLDWRTELHRLWRDLYFALGWKNAYGPEGEEAIEADLEEAYRLYNLKPGVLE